METDKRRQLRDAFGAFMTGVTVVTSIDNKGQPIGFTANSFTSVSLEPALLLISIDKRSANLENFTHCSHFAVNILSEQQKSTSMIFASKQQDRFAQVNWHHSTQGVPVIDGCSAWFECEYFQKVDAGDHSVLFGKIIDFASYGIAGLGYYRGTYYTPWQNAESLMSTPKVVVGALIEAIGHVALIKKNNGQFSVPVRQVVGCSVAQTLRNLIQDLAIPANPGFVYSVFDDRQHNQQYIIFLCSLSVETEQIIDRQDHTQWFSLNQLAKLSIDDAALKSMLDRFIHENTIGNYGIYFGDENTGSVKQFAR